LTKELYSKASAHKAKIHYGQIDQTIIQYLKKSVRCRTGKVTYNINSSIKDLSTQPIPVIDGIRFIRPLNLEMLEDCEDWEEFICESELDPPDIDTMKEILNGIDGNLYVKSSTSIFNKGDYTEVTANMTWIVILASEGNASWTKFYRQTGENICILTDMWMPNFAKCTKAIVRRVNFKNHREMAGCIDMDYLVYFLPGKDILNSLFLDLYIGGQPINISKEILDATYSNYFINNDGIMGPINFKFDQKIKLYLTAEEISLKEAEEAEKKKEKMEHDKKIKDFLKNKGKLNSELTKACDSKIISKQTVELLRDKYSKAALDSAKIVKVESLVTDLMSELKLQGLKVTSEDLIKGYATPEELNKMNQAPEHWGMAYSSNKIANKKMFVDKRIEIELAAIHEDLPHLIASGNLTISRRYAKLMYTNCNLWRNAIKYTKYKKTNKEFGLTTLIGAVNDASLSADARTDKGVQHDNMWREIIESTSLYIGDEGPDFEDDEMKAFLGPDPSSRLKYTPYRVYGQ
jgi:hypothetical protein